MAHWAGEVTLFGHGPEAAARIEPSPRHRMVAGEITAVEEDAGGTLGIVAAQGRHEVDVLFKADLPPQDAEGGLAAGPGLESVAHPLNGKPIWKADAVGRTSLGSCFMSGDTRTGLSTLTGAANEGETAGFMMVNDIIEAREKAAQPAF